MHSCNLRGDHKEPSESTQIETKIIHVAMRFYRSNQFLLRTHADEKREVKWCN